MQILTPSGYRNADTLSVGDEVCAFDMVSGAPIINTIESQQWVDAGTFRDWQNSTFLINGSEHFGLHSLYVLRPPKNAPQPVNVRDLSVGDQVFRIEHGDYIFDYEITSIVQVDPYQSFQFFLVNGSWALNSEQSIWRNGDRVCHARDLVVGDVIYDDADHDVTITSIEEVTSDGWWRFDISNDHSYIVDGLTLHNASRFWVGGTGTWDGVTTTHWAAATNAAGGQSVPGSADTITFDFNSDLVAGAHTTATVTVNTTVNAQSIAMGTFGATGGAVALSGIGILDFATNNNNVTLTGTNAFSGTGTGTRTLNLGNGTWTITGIGTVWNIITTTGLTFNANSSTLVFTATSLTARTFNGNLTYNNITVSANTSGGNFQFSTACTVGGTETINAPNVILYTSSTTHTVATLNVNGASSVQVFMKSSTDGTAGTISVASNAPTITWAGLRDITCTGGATFAATSSFDLGHNSGVTITPPTNTNPVGQFISAQHGSPY